MTHLSDENLVTELKNSVQTEKNATATVLKYLSEMDRRKLWAKLGFASLWDYCVRELKYSDGETARRIHSARALKKFPAIEQVLKREEINLTTLSLLTPVLTQQNHRALIDEVKNKPTKDVRRIIKTHFPDKVLPKDSFKPVTAKLTLVSFLADDETLRAIEDLKNRKNQKEIREILKPLLLKELAGATPRSAAVQKHTRYVPEAIKRAVEKRDGGKCTFPGCNARTFLEYDHVRPWGKGGSSHDVENIRLLCRAHNQLKAAEDYRDLAVRSKGGRRE